MSDTVTPTDASFLGIFPEFNDSTKYPGTVRAFWLRTAVANMDALRWGEYYELGLYLWMAHHMTLFATQRQGSGGRTTSGLVSSKSVGGVSVSYDTGSIIEQGGGVWNATTYGMRWIQLANLVGMGGVQVGGGPIQSPGAGFGGIQLP